MKLPNNGGDGSSAGHFSSPNVAPSAGNGLHLIKFLAMGTTKQPRLLPRLSFALHKVTARLTETLIGQNAENKTLLNLNVT